MTHTPHDRCLVGTTPVEILDIWYKTQDGTGGTTGSGYLPAFLSGPVTVAEPLFHNFVNKPKIAIVRCRIGLKVLYIGATDQSVLKLNP